MSEARSLPPSFLDPNKRHMARSRLPSCTEDFDMLLADPSVSYALLGMQRACQQAGQFCRAATADNGLITAALAMVL